MNPDSVWENICNQFLLRSDKLNWCLIHWYDLMQVSKREPSFACRGWRISERCDLSWKLLWLRVAARSQVHTNTSSRPAGRFLQPLSFQQTEFQCEPPPLQRLTRGIEEAGKGDLLWKHYRMHQTSTLWQGFAGLISQVRAQQRSLFATMSSVYSYKKKTKSFLYQILHYVKKSNKNCN